MPDSQWTTCFLPLGLLPNVQKMIGALAVQISDPIQKSVGGGNQKDVTTG